MPEILPVMYLPYAFVPQECCTLEKSMMNVYNLLLKFPFLLLNNLTPAPGMYTFHTFTSRILQVVPVFQLVISSLQFSCKINSSSSTKHLA